MPPLIGIDRGLNGEALKALEESGHGRRVAIVDASYDIPRGAQKVDYRGQTSAAALKGIIEICPVENSDIFVMFPDADRPSALEQKAWLDFTRVVATANKTVEGFDNGDVKSAEIGEDGLPDSPELSGFWRTSELDVDGDPGFYDRVNDSQVDTLFIRTPDTLPYACATFVVGHSQTAE